MPYINGTRYSPRIYLSGAIAVGRPVGLSIGRSDIAGLSMRNFQNRTSCTRARVSPESSPSTLQRVSSQRRRFSGREEERKKTKHAAKNATQDSRIYISVLKFQCYPRGLQIISTLRKWDASRSGSLVRARLKEDREKSEEKDIGIYRALRLVAEGGKG